jgi:hypothetical protein
MKYLYKYPQSAYPYADLVTVSQSRSRSEFEHELLDTGIFAGLVARLIQAYGHLDSETIVKAGKRTGVQYIRPEKVGRKAEPAELTPA